MSVTDVKFLLVPPHVLPKGICCLRPVVNPKPNLFSAGLLQQLVRRVGHRAGEHRLLQGRDSLLRHDHQETLPSRSKSFEKGKSTLKTNQ